MDDFVAFFVLFTGVVPFASAAFLALLVADRDKISLNCGIITVLLPVGFFGTTGTSYW